MAYDPNTGLFTWRIATARNVKAGARAGHLESNGYVRVAINKKRYAAHRLAWFYMHGKWPTNQIDHINRKSDDNRIANLRESTHSENQQNRNFKGVYLTRNNTWFAQIKANGKRHCLGCFPTEAAARAAYIEAKKLLHPSWTD